MTHCATNPITRSWIGRTAYELRHRTGYNSSQCNRGVHGGSHSEVFNSGFHERCGDWIIFFNDNVVRPTQGWTVNWVGDVGITACDDSGSWHYYGRAFDLTAILFTNDTRIDMNRDWRRDPGNSCYSQAQRRRYLAVAATLRRYFQTVLTGWYTDTAHDNHIHFDNGSTIGPIRDSAESDTSLVQAACNYINGESLAIDGAWGPLTDSAFQRLRTDLNMRCKDIRGSLADTREFLTLVAKTGMANLSAGAYKSNC
jgi:hypothetical protein